MTAKQYLKQIKTLEGRIKRCEARISSLVETVSYISAVRYDSIKVQSSGDPNRKEDIIADIISLEREWRDMKVALERKKLEVTKSIHTIDYADGENVLYMRWVEGLDFYDIADSIPCSLRQVHRIHSTALQLLSEKLAHNVT